MYKRSIDYDSASIYYDEVREGNPEMVDLLLKDLELFDDAIVVDIGCGTCNNTTLFSMVTGAKTIGIDFSYGMLNKARTKSEGIELVQGTADTLPMGDESVHFVFMTEVLHHLPDMKQAIQEIYRIMEAGGVVCIVTQSHRQIAMRTTSRFFPTTCQIDQERYPAIRTIEEALKDCGFKEIDSKSYRFQPIILGLDYLKTVETKGYSMLHKITQEEYDSGLTSLRVALDKEQLLYSPGYTFVWGRSI